MSIYTNDLRKAVHAMDEMQSGIVYVNAPTIGAEIQLPLGGARNTGNGHREAGTVALDEFTEWKTIYVAYSRRRPRAQRHTRQEPAADIAHNTPFTHHRQQRVRSLDQ